MAISLPVVAAPDNRSFDRVADNAQKRFATAGKESGQAFSKGLDDAISKSDPKAVEKWTRAYDKVADAAGKVRAEEARLAELRNRGAGEAQLVRQSEALERSRRAEARAMREAGEAYGALGQKAGGLRSTLMDLASASRFGGMIGDTEALTARFSGMGLAVGASITAVAGLAIGVGAATSKLYEMGAMWDDVADGITARTGKVGAELDAVMNSVTEVATRSSLNIGKLGDIAGQVSVLMGQSGDGANQLIEYLGDLNEIQGQQTNIRELSQLYRIFNITGTEQVDMLNQLYTQSTQTLIPVNEMVATMVNAGPTAKSLGLSWGELAGVLGEFNQQGIKGDVAAKGLKAFSTEAVKAGREPRQALTEVIDEIQRLYATGETLKGSELAENWFGTKNFQAFIPALQDGRLNVKALGDAFGQTTKDIKDTKEATDDAAQRFDNLKSRLEVELKPASEKVFGVINDALESMIDQIDRISNADWSGLWGVLNRPIGGPFSGGQGGGDYLGGGGDFGGSGGGNGWFGPGVGGDTVRGTPGRGFPMPWNGTLGAAPSNMHGSHEQIGVLARVAKGMGLEFASGADNHSQDSGFHPTGQAGDFSNQKAYGPNTPEMNAYAEAMLQYAPYIRELIYSGASQNIYKGKLVPAIDQPGSPYNTGQAGYHGDHVHIAVEDGMAAQFEAAIKGGTVRGTPGQGFPMPWKLGGPGDDSDSVGGLGRSAGIPLNLPPGFNADNPDATPTPSGSGITSNAGPIQQPRNQVFPLGQSTSTPGYGDDGQPGAYFTDPKQIRGAQERISDIEDRIAAANQRILDLKDQQEAANQRIKDAQDKVAESTAAGSTSTIAEREALRQQVDKATADRDKITNRDIPAAEADLAKIKSRDLRDANESLADAQKGRFKANSRSGRGGLGSQIGAPIDADFGLSGGLSGLAENVTNFLANMAFAPMLGALGAVSYAADPAGINRGAGGLIGMAAVNNGWSGAAGGGGGLGGALTGAFGVPDGSAPEASTVSGVAPGAGPGGAGFGGVGGLAMDGIKAATAGLDMLAPGAGVAAQIGIQLANRTIAQAGKTAGIVAGGLGETFAMPGVDPSQSWFGRIASGFAGAKPALPNKAGGAAAAPQLAGAHGQANGAAPGPGITVNYTNNQATEDRAGADLTNHLTAMYAGPGQ